jgi:CspA family cold shock protein
MKGKVKFFNNTKGFGFIAGDDGKEYFVHQSGLDAGVTIRDNDSVNFEIVQGDRGLKAEKVSKDDSAAD